MFTKDLERLVRSMAAQRLDPDYIRYYLIETYQLDSKTVDAVFKAQGIGKTKEKFSTKLSSEANGGEVKVPRKPFS
jgi:methionyl-tRNA synthetase